MKDFYEILQSITKYKYIHIFDQKLSKVFVLYKMLL